MSELQGAVGVAQMDRLAEGIKRRIEQAQLLRDLLAAVQGIELPVVLPNATHSYWRVTLRVDDSVIPGGPDALAAALRGYDVASAPRYVRKPAFECRVFTDRVTFGSSQWPFTLASEEALDHAPGRFAGTYAALATMLVLPFNERYEGHHTEALAAAIADAAEECSA